MHNLKTSHICDHSDAKISVLNRKWIDYGNTRCMSGEAVVIESLNYYGIVLTALEESGNGKILVVDGKNSTEYALFDDNLAVLAVSNEWKGIIVNGYIRDVKELKEFNLCINALGSHPLKASDIGEGTYDHPAYIGGAIIKPGDLIVADEDGIIVISKDSEYDIGLTYPYIEWENWDERLADRANRWVSSENGGSYRDYNREDTWDYNENGSSYNDNGRYYEDNTWDYDDNRWGNDNNEWDNGNDEWDYNGNREANGEDAWEYNGSGSATRDDGTATGDQDSANESNWWGNSECETK